MSVRLINPDELAGVAKRYSLHQDQCYAPKLADVLMALDVLQYANHMAYRLTYRHEEMPEIVAVESLMKGAKLGMDAFTPAADRQLVQDIRNLLYNCISNGGTDCMPETYRAVLDQAQHVITDRLAGIN